MTYITPQGTKYNCIVEDEEILSGEACDGGLKPNYWKRKNKQNKWKFLAPLGLHPGKYTFVGQKNIHKIVYPDSDIRSKNGVLIKNDLDTIPNANIASVEGNLYSLEVSPAFSFCLNHHKTEDLKQHLSCLDCEMPRVDFSHDLSTMTVLKGREYLYPLVCSIPAKNTPFIYVVKLDTTQVAKSLVDISKVDQTKNMEEEITTHSSGKGELNQHAKHFVTTQKSSSKKVDTEIKFPEKGSQDNTGNGRKCHKKVTRILNEGKMTQHFLWPEHSPVIDSKGYTALSFYVPWMCFCVTTIALFICCICLWLSIKSKRKIVERLKMIEDTISLV